MASDRLISKEASTQEDSKVKEIQSILYLLQESLERFKNEADRSYALFQVGTKTELTKEIEDLVNNPLKSVIQSSSAIENQVKSIIAKLVEQFFLKNQELIQRVYATKNSNNDLYYSIVLKEDTIENRQSIFSFFELYDKLEINSRYPVFFQFVPHELIGKVNVADEINLQNSAKPHSTSGA